MLGTFDRPKPGQRVEQGKALGCLPVTIIIARA